MGMARERIGRKGDCRTCSLPSSRAASRSALSALCSKRALSASAWGKDTQKRCIVTRTWITYDANQRERRASRSTDVNWRNGWRAWASKRAQEVCQGGIVPQV